MLYMNGFINKTVLCLVSRCIKTFYDNKEFLTSKVPYQKLPFITKCGSFFIKKRVGFITKRARYYKMPLQIQNGDVTAVML